MSLNHDILLNIFEILTEPIPDNLYTPIEENERPLAQVRTASQVCRRWRGVLLASSRIWGRVMDLGGKKLGRGRAEWLDEVMTRARSSPLWIYGEVIHPRRGSLFDGETYLVRLLDSLERVEKLSLNFCGQQIPEEIQRCFMTRAPMLKSFDVRHNMYPPETERTALFRESLESSQSLFANHAPLLTEIKVHHFFFKLDLPWVPNIRVLTVSISEDFLTVPMLFTLLQHTPLLEEMSLSSPSLFAWDPTGDPFPALNLPRLSVIEIFSSLAVVATLLGRITPGALSGLYIGLRRVQGADDHFLQTDLQNSLRRYMYKHFTTNTARGLLFTLSPKEFSLYDLTPFQPLEAEKHHIVFDIRIQVVESVPESDDGMIQAPAHPVSPARTVLDVFNLISSWKPSIFQSVALLRMRSAESFSSDELSAMYKTFPHVQDLQTAPEFMTSLSRIDDDGLNADEPQTQDSFPELRKLRFISDQLGLNDALLRTPLTRFLTRRRDIGKPVAKVDFRACRFRHAQDLTHLDAFKGMEVAWRHGVGAGEFTSYICGSGNPERLAISALVGL